MLLTRPAGGSIVPEWFSPDACLMDDNRIDALHGKVDQRLKDNEQDLRSERRQLLEKNREAKQRLQSILMRLKAMENP